MPNLNARVAELVDALDLGSSVVKRESSSLSFRTKLITVSLVETVLLIDVKPIWTLNQLASK